MSQTTLHAYLQIKRRASTDDGGAKRRKIDTSIQSEISTSPSPAPEVTKTKREDKRSTGSPARACRRNLNPGGKNRVIDKWMVAAIEADGLRGGTKAIGAQGSVGASERTPPNSHGPLPMAETERPKSPEVVEILKPAQPLQEADAPQLNKFKLFTVESPKKKSQPPAYQRYAGLVDLTSCSSKELALPDHYKLLSEKFRCTDTVVNMFQKRSEVCTYNKLKHAVQDMLRRSFEQSNLAQMKTVYPDAYLFRQEKAIPGTYLDSREREKYHLTIECNLSSNGINNELKFLGTTALVNRMHTFKKGLLHITLAHHRHFLKTLSPPIDIPDEDVIRWHPEFDVSHVPDIEEAELPKPPMTESYNTAKDVLHAAHNRFTAKLQKALSNASVCSEESKVLVPPSSPSPSVPLDPSLVGISPLLLEKVRQKESARATAIITRDPAIEKKLYMLEKLPEFCRILKAIFVGEQKVALPLDDVVQKVSESSGIAQDSVLEHLNLLRGVVPDWATLVTIRKKEFLKVSKTMDIRTIVGVLEQERKKVANE